MASVEFNELMIEEALNRKQAEELALNAVANIEIPVFNTLAALTKQELMILLNKFKANFLSLSEPEKSYFLVLITDLVTSVIKHNTFYDSFQGNYNLVQLLCKHLKAISCIKIEEFDQMVEYSKRIPQYPVFKMCLEQVRDLIIPKKVILVCGKLPTDNSNTKKGILTDSTNNSNNIQNIVTKRSRNAFHLLMNTANNKQKKI